MPVKVFLHPVRQLSGSVPEIVVGSWQVLEVWKGPMTLSLGLRFGYDDQSIVFVLFVIGIDQMIRHGVEKEQSIFIGLKQGV